MKKSEIEKMPEYFDRYINLVEDIDVTDALKKYGANLFAPGKMKQLGDKVYEPGKWTAKDIIQHLIDAERVFSYRAMRFARNDKTTLPGFDENEFALTAGASRRNLDDLLNEFNAVRQSTINLYRSFDNEMLKREGKSFSKDISVLAIGFTIAGHVVHHDKILKERYYKLIQ
ncbi:MAG: DinB family protein [Bacteroidia bacterium]